MLLHESSEPLTACRLFSYACSTAIMLDYLSPRPGLAYIGSKRTDIPGLSFIVFSSAANNACLYACQAGYLFAHMAGYSGLTTLWRRAIEELAWLGNPAMGSLLLLVFQAGGLGCSIGRYGADKLEYVMGCVKSLAEHSGVEAAKDFYRVLFTLSPSYLYRIEWDGLPDASTPTSLDDIESRGIEFKELACKASLYDQVLGDLCRGMEYSLGLIYSILRDKMEEGLLKAIIQATLESVEILGDFVLYRKTGYRQLNPLIASHDKEVDTVLALLRAGPSSIADLVVNAVARLVYEALSSRSTLPL